MYKFTIKDYGGKLHEVEVSKEVYEVMRDSDKYIDRQRKARNRHNAFDDFSHYENRSEIACPSPENIYILNETIKQIYFVLDSCTEKQRERFLLWAIDGMTYREIAKLEKISYFATHKSISHVSKKIKEILEIL